MLFDQVWRIWCLAARQQKEADIKSCKIPLGSVVVFRRDERQQGCLKNRFSTGLILRLGEPNLDGVVRSVYILVVCKEEKESNGEAPLTKRIFHRRYEDIILTQTESSLEMELAIAEEWKTHQSQPGAIELSGVEEEEDDEGGEGTQASLLVSAKKRIPSPSFSLLIIADRLDLCQADEMQADEGSMGDYFTDTILSLILLLMIIMLARKTPIGSYLLTPLLFLPRVVQAAPWQGLVPLEPEDVASFLIQEMLKRIKEKLKNEALS